MKKNYDAVIIGAGAAGLFCAYKLSEQGKSVLLLDHNKKIARKIKVSGGGRCNFTNINASAHNYRCQSPHFVKPALKNYTSDDFIQLVEKHKISYYEKELGQIFTTNGSQQIIDMLVKLCIDNKTSIQHPVNIEKIHYKEGFYHINYIHKEQNIHTDIQAMNLIIATGGLSFKKLGASGFGYDVARQFDHKITPLSPALVGFKFAEDFSSLSGISIKAKISCNKQDFTHNILFTHFGISGPAILQISNYWQQGLSITVDFLPDIQLDTLIQKARKENPKINILNLLKDFLPRKFIKIILKDIDFQTKNISELSNKQISLLITRIHSLQLCPISTAGYDKAEITRGGINISQICAKSMESKIQTGLFFIGEVIDVSGWLGGYNFQWAWSSAALAATYISSQN